MPQVVADPDLSDRGRAATATHAASGQATSPEAGVDLSGLAPPFSARGATDATRSWFANVLDGLPAAVYMTDAEGWLTYCNRAAALLAGREPTLGEDRWCVAFRLFTMDGKPLAHENCVMARSLRERRAIRGVEALMERPDGTRVPFAPFPTPLFDAQGTLVGGFNLLIDISERKDAERRIAHLARHDALTGLHNRAALNAHLADRLARARQAGESVCVLRIDLDGFKTFNDDHGHSTGDAILIEIAQRLRQVAGDAFLARIGGDEFMLVSPAGSDGLEAWAWTEQVREALSAEFVNGARRVFIGSSAGCARFPQDADSETALVAAAQVALELAKAEGRGGIRMFDPEQQERERERISLRTHLRDAIETGAIRLHYQPQFRADGVVIGFEALARWHDPARGVVEPSTFIPAAEQGGLIAALGIHVLRSACLEAATWPNPLRICVNVSALEFESGLLPGLVETVLAETGLDPERLELEITESVMVTNADRAMASLSRLRALGVRLALDDFGTGYSSLSYLHRFPLTTLKIDRSFVATLGVTLEAVAITRAVIQLGHTLGIEVVAEGVETPEQLDFLISEGCDLTQGYLLGRPLEASAYAHLTGAG